MRKHLLLLVLLLTCSLAGAQNRTISGTVIDKTSNEPVAGVNIVVRGTTTGTATDGAGKYSISVPASGTSLVVSFVGYVTQEIPISASNVIDISLEPSVDELAEIVISVGSRGPQRTITDTPLPIDNLTVGELNTTGQITFDKALQYRVPSFNTVNTPVNDATSLFDPYEIRNLGPSRTLILINGKRKNLTSLVYTQTSPGRGETGADLSAIPVDAIKRVEILRDGASAQYGSDAIAGVMNIILKDQNDGTSVTFNTGSTMKFGGLSYGLNYNSGANFGGKGFVNYHISFNRTEAAIRKDPVSVEGDSSNATGFSGGDPTMMANIRDYLEIYPDGNNKNGTPDNTSAKFLINTVIPVGLNSELYANAAYVYRKTLSNANYRVPYWRQDFGLLHVTDPTAPNYTGDNTLDGNGDELYAGYIGYQPTFEGDLNDYHATIGLRSQNLGGWKHDMSLTVGGNKMLFTVNNTVNASLGFNSPISFKPGGFAFNHVVGNVDLSRPLSDKIFLAVGSEFRAENYQLIAGDTSTYVGEGTNSFPGFEQDNAVKANRFNLGAYIDLTWDITEDFLIGGTFRSETYSDFGAANVFKATTRYKVGESITIRGSFSTGFRAPTLHQQFLSLSQASFEAGNIVKTGLRNNYSREARLLGVPRLKAEKSQNVSFGLGFNPSTNLSLTADFYSINITDRIVYSNEVTNTYVTRTSFFINAAETNTSGVDIVASYRNISLGSAKLGLNLAGNYTMKNELVGGWQGVNADIGLPIFNDTQEALLTTSRPKYKFILGADLGLEKLSINLNNSLFGPTTFNNADLSDDLELSFIPKVLTDLGVMYKISSNATASFTIQNLLNVFPEYELKAYNANGEAILNNSAALTDQINLITFNGRYPVVSYDGSHFSQMGTSFLAQLTYKF